MTPDINDIVNKCPFQFSYKQTRHSKGSNLYLFIDIMFMENWSEFSKGDSFNYFLIETDDDQNINKIHIPTVEEKTYDVKGRLL